MGEATAADTERAIGAARAAFDDGRWSDVPAPERGALLLRVADLLERDKDRLARAETADTGKRLVESEYDMDDIASCFRYYAGLAGTDAGRRRRHRPRRRDQPQSSTSRSASAR